MKRDLDTPILNLDGTEFADNVTLGKVVFNAVTAPHADDAQHTIDQKMALYRLAQKVVGGGVVELSAEDIALIKVRIGKVFAHVVVIGRSFEILEGER